MTWSYRIVRRRDGGHLALHEVYYDGDGKPWGMTENPVTFVADADESPSAIIMALRFALRDADWPVLDEPEVWPGREPDRG